MATKAAAPQAPTARRSRWSSKPGPANLSPLFAWLTVVTLQDDFAGAGADAGSLTVAGESLVAIHDWTFLLGPGFCVGVNGLLLGYLFYRSGPCRGR